jgi:hypothetical protein
MFLDTIGNWWGFVAHQAHIKYVSVFTEIYSSFPFWYVKVRINFKRMVNPLPISPGQPWLDEAPSSRDGKHTLMHITYRIYDSGQKPELAIMIQFIGNLSNTCSPFCRSGYACGISA